MKLPAYLLAIVFLLKGLLLSSQTCDSMIECNCAVKDLSPAGIMLGHEHPKGVWKVSYRYMNMMMNGNVSGIEKVDDNFIFNNYIMSPESMRMDMHMVMAMYGITNRLSLMAMFNYNVSSMKMNMLPGLGHVHGGNASAHNSKEMRSQTSGLGDTKLYAVYSLLNSTVHYLLLSGGLNLPSGNIQMKGDSPDPMYPSQRLPYMMQMGSGTVDFMPGITYLVKEEKVSFSTQITSVLRPFYNSLNYGLGNEYALNIWGAYKLFPWVSSSVRIEGISLGAIVGSDKSLFSGMEPSASALNYGGENVSAYLGLNFYFLKKNKLSIEYGMPLYQNVNGVQMKQTSTIYAGWLISL